MRKRSGSNKCFICAKAKRQRQMFYLCESATTATKRPVGTEISHTFGDEPYSTKTSISFAPILYYKATDFLVFMYYH
ncbi:hypothetical protein ACIQ57_13975 [Lysinibacillus xylanilyticus]|uniref:hypothetical protein n=1 Tax=Lysinibacillus xylanilyticus TaxID=582475 RepID=UPI00382BFEA3